MNETDVKTVNIPLEEYCQLRREAEMNRFLIEHLGQLEGRFFDFDRRIYELEQKVVNPK